MVALYLAYTATGLPQKEIGAVFGAGRYAVSTAALGVRGPLQRIPRLRRLVDELKVEMAAPSHG
jgi:hypothetical protein